MQIKFIRLIDELFEGVPQTKQTLEMKEEIVQNLMEKYNDLRADGKTEADAFAIAAASVGDIHELIGEPTKPEPPTATQSYYDTPVGDEITDDKINMNGNAWNEDTAWSNDTAQTSVSMHWPQAIIISSVLFTLSPFVAMYIRGMRGIFLMIIMIFSGTGLLVYQVLTRNKTRMHNTKNDEQPYDSQHVAYDTDDTVYDDGNDEPVDNQKVYRSLRSALWITAVAVYFLISFSFDIWYISWIIFLIVPAISSILRASFGLMSFQKALTRTIWVLTTAAFFIISFATQAWHITWIVFLIAAAISNILKASRELTKR